ncbi:MAG: hypothetical protein JNK63_07735 [Chthonomonas sp.]|nr:hypothetical protein [Chthonomonas sp.]
MEFKSVRTFRAFIGCVFCFALLGAAHAQVPDLLNAFEATGRNLGLGSGIGATSSNPASAINNPAGLGYANKAAFSVTMRNMPETTSKLSRNFVSPDISTTGKSGNYSITQVGLIRPMRGNSAIGLNYSVAGYIRDFASGTGLIDGGTILNNFQEDMRLKTDLFTLSWGQASRDYTKSYGVGVIFANHGTRNRQQYALFDNNGTPGDTGDDTFISNVFLNNSGTQSGIGVVAGIQFNPNADFSYGVSLRSPITLSGGGEVADYYKRVPGKASFAAAKRIQTARRAEDFVLIGGQVDWFFGGKRSTLVDRDGSQLGFGFGAEYNYRFRGAFVPIRMGYRNVAKGGDGFGSFNAFTFGLGYNPDQQNFGIDLDFSSNSRGGTDMALMLSYRFK